MRYLCTSRVDALAHPILTAYSAYYTHREDHAGRYSLAQRSVAINSLPWTCLRDEALKDLSRRFCFASPFFVGHKVKD